MPYAPKWEQQEERERERETAVPKYLNCATFPKDVSYHYVTIGVIG
jgi:hypothetical protein